MGHIIRIKTNLGSEMIIKTKIKKLCGFVISNLVAFVCIGGINRFLILYLEDFGLDLPQSAQNQRRYVSN